MAGYWPSSFGVEVEVHKLAKQGRRQYPAIMTEKAWSIKDLFFGFRANFSRGTPRVVPSAPSCPLGQPITGRDLVHLARSRS